MEKLSELNVFRVRKATISSTFLIKFRFDRVLSSFHGGSLEITHTVPLIPVLVLHLAGTTPWMLYTHYKCIEDI